MSKPRLLLIGWDAADWKIIRPLLSAGQMPNLARLMAGGVHGNLATIYPVLSPMLWTSIATGKRAYKHGIHGFSEPLPDGSGIRPVTLLSRKTKAVWNILNQTGHRSIVVGWWPSHPAEPLNGAMVSNFFRPRAGKPGPLPPLPAGTVHPPTLAASLAELRVNPVELTGEFIRLFVPEFEKVDQTKDKRLHSLCNTIAETMTTHAAATQVLATEPWDFAAVYYSGIDHFGHSFMSYHPPRLPWVSEEDFAIYQHVIANVYRYHDAMLGTLLSFADERTTVVLMSDHGFHPDHLRPSYIPAEPAGPAIEHRHFGILCMKGPGLRADETLYGASLLDICPTILAVFGLPPGRDMDGKVLLTAFKAPLPVEPIPGWDSVPGDAGTHPPQTLLDPIASVEAFRQLVELGYVAPPAANTQATIDECVRELKYNLARAYLDGDFCAEAADLAEEIWARWPSEHRFGILLVDALGRLSELPRRRAAIEQLDRRIEEHRAKAREELARRGKEPKAAPPETEQARAQFEERRLQELARGRPHLTDWFLLTQALLEKEPDEARGLLDKLDEAEGLNPYMDTRLAGALAELGESGPARALLEAALESDPENPVVHAQLAALHARAGRFPEVIVAATESLSLLYFQPGLHALLGRALMETKQFAEAEQELKVAVAQSNRNLFAHELLAELYRVHLNRPADAFAHDGRARSLRHELAAQQRAAAENRPAEPLVPGEVARDGRTGMSDATIGPVENLAPFGPEVAPDQIITVVSGLPRSGTSMMMQLLAAAGREALTDARRAPDEDNPLGYFEFEKVLNLPSDSSWLPQARGKVVKIVAQLLPSLPPTEHYQVVFMERDLAEVIASQNAMLSRQGRRGAELAEARLLETYAAQLQRIRAQLTHRSNIRLLRVKYAELLAAPVAGIERLHSFVGEPFDGEAAVAAVRPQLRRQKSEGG